MYPRHLKAFDYQGCHRYFLTFCTFERQRHFVIRERVDLVLTQILRAAAEEGFAVVAYCFMPDHVRLLIEGTSLDSDGRRFIRKAKQYSGFYFKQSLGGELWQRYGYEHVLRNEEDLLPVARYILENPVRAGLVDRVDDYPFSGSRVYAIADILEAVAMDWRSGKGRSS